MRFAKKPITLEEALARSASEVLESFARHVNPVEARLFRLANVAKRYVHAEGLYLYDEAGRRYMDFTAGYGALNLGHNPPEVLAAVRQAQSLPAVLLTGYSPLMGALGESLGALLPDGLSMVAFGSGGAEAVELALKTARAATGRQRFVSCDGGYHGLSFGALSISGSPRYRALFGPLLPECVRVPYGDARSLRNALSGRDVAAFIVEPVQGEGGAVVPPPGYLQEAQAACRACGTLMVVDEIQTGFGRTGRLFAIERDGVAPDIVLLSKSLGAGAVPVSACCTTEAIWQRAFGSRERFDFIISTFGGNSAACAAALKSIEIILREDLAGRAAALGQHARARLEALAAGHRMVQSIRGEGLLLGIEIAAPALLGHANDENAAVVVASALFNEHGVLTAYFDLAPNVLRFEPPLTVTREEIDYAIDALDDVLGRGATGLAFSAAKNALAGFLHRDTAHH